MKNWVTCVFLLLFNLVFSASPATVLFDGHPRLPIILHPSASEGTLAVAKEFSGYLEKMTGHSFDIMVANSAAKPGIYIGTTGHFPLPQFAKDLEIRRAHDGLESLVIHPDGESLHLVGATELGASHAVFTFLERLGCRWYFPAKEWEIVPELDRIVADFEVIDRPAIPSRRIWWGYGCFDHREGRCREDYEAWARHNRMAESLKIQCGHAWQSVIIGNQKTFDAHPEFYALVKGERKGPQLCVSNPEVRKICTDWALAKLERFPEHDMVSMETSDGLGHCECEKCVAMGSVSERVFGLANEVARAVDKAYPGKMVGMLAYSDHCEPPSFQLEPNVYVQSTNGFVRGKYSFDELLELWPQKTRNIGFYEYLSVWPWDFDQLPGGRANDISKMTANLRNYAKAGATSVSCESSNNWGLNGRGYYLANRLMWNPDVAPDEVLADFYQKAFGPAACAMRRYYERFDGGNQPMLSEHLLALGFRDVQEAVRLSEGRPDVLARLRHIQQYLHYVRVRWELSHLPKAEKERRKAFTLDGLSWGYRTRYSYMNHWAAMRQSWTDDAAKEFEDPLLSYRAKETQPWKSDEPVTAEETERVFQADLARFQPVKLLERDFSQNLVPSGLANAHPGKVRPQPLSHLFQRPKRYVAYGKAGETVKFTITTGVIPHYRDRADGIWKVTDALGNLLGAGHLPQDGQDHPVEITPKSTGLLWIDFNDFGGGWGISAEEGTPLCFAIPRGQRILHLGQFRQPLFFFVPKGTKRLQFFFEGNLQPHLHQPDGTVARVVTENGKYVEVEVPEGLDGQAWHFTRFAPKNFWFVNAPNYLAASPETLLVPKEVKP